MNKIYFFLNVLLIILLISPIENSFAKDKSIMMATTTSTDGTGLLDYLIPHFEKETGINLKWTATGTGKALKLGQNCDVDVLLVHAPPAEKKYIENGFGKDRRQIMYNDFVIIGPAADPAAVKGQTITAALNAVRKTHATFVSRGDDSGTHKKEKLLWKSTGADLPEKEPWYLQVGKGMQATITVCEEKKGYTMTDRGSYIKYMSAKGGNPPLKILVEGDDILLNQYSVLTLSPQNCPNAKYDLALTFSNWMASKNAQDLIRDFRLMGQKLFIPNAQ